MALRPRKWKGGGRQGRNIEHTGFYPYLARFLEAMLVNGCSRDTHKRRDHALRRFIEWCDERGLQEPRDITKPILERYKRHLFYYRKADGSPLTLASQNVMLTPLKAFFKWLTRENLLLYNPASEVEMPKKPRRLPRAILSVEQVENILAQPDIGTPSGLRDRAIIETFYSTGVRRYELCKLALYDVDIRRHIVIVREGKGAEDRYIPIGKRAAVWIEKYLNEVRPLLVSPLAGEALFLTDFGEPFGRSYLAQLVKRYIVQAGIDVTGSCHLFRHAMASHMLKNGANLRIIQAILGHVDLTSTQIYLHVSIDDLQEIHAATHPAKLHHGDETSALLEALKREADEESDLD